MRGPNHYDALKQGQHKDAEQEQTQAQQGKDSTQHQNSNTEPYLSDDDKRDAAIVAKAKELQSQVDAGEIKWWDKRYEMYKDEPSPHTVEQQATKTSAQRGGDRETTGAKQQQEEKMARFRERMNESEQSYSLGRENDGHER
jgi:hypothetical protein